MAAQRRDKVMNLEFLYERYSFYTKEASTIVRQLGFAGIALIWIFKIDQGGQPRVPSELIPAGILIVLGLSFDLLHYVAGSLIWGVFHRQKDLQVTSTKETFDAPRWINWPTNTLFALKIIAVALAYVFILIFLIKRLA